MERLENHTLPYALPTRERLLKTFPHATTCHGNGQVVDVGKAHYDPPGYPGGGGFCGFPYIQVQQLECTSCHLIREYQVVEE